VADKLIAQGGAPEGYELVRVLGVGGSSVVYEARHGSDKATCALKVINLEPLGPGDLASFDREIEAIRRVAAHPGAVGVIDVGLSSRGQPFLVMPLADESIQQKLDRAGPFDWETASQIIHDVGGALTFAHRRGVFHRDLKPSNILMFDGDAKLADFGIAKVVEDSSFSTSLRMTPAFAPPERFGGQPATEQSEVYSLALTLCVLLLGTNPHASRSGSTPASVMRSVLKGWKPEFDDTLMVPDEAIATIRRALSTSPRQRPSSVDEFLRQLGGGADHTMSLSTKDTEQSEQPTTILERRPKTLLGRVVVASFFLLAFAFFLFLRGSSQSNQATLPSDPDMVEPTVPRDEPIPSATRIPLPEPEPTAAGALSQESVINIEQLVVSDEGASNAQFGIDFDLAISIVEEHLGPVDAVDESVFDGLVYADWSDGEGTSSISLISIDGSTFDGWRSFGLHPDITIDGIAGPLTGIDFTTSPGGLRSVWPGIPASSDLPMTIWLGSALVATWGPVEELRQGRAVADLSAMELFHVQSFGNEVESQGQIQIIADGVNVRVIPGTGTEVIGIASSGDVYELLSTTEAGGRQWSFIVPLDEALYSGWIASEFTEPLVP